jgi:hypothetical protein
MCRFTSQNGMVELGLAKSLHPSRFSNNPIQGHSSFASQWTADEGIVAKQKFGPYVTEREPRARLWPTGV